MLDLLTNSRIFSAALLERQTLWSKNVVELENFILPNTGPFHLISITPYGLIFLTLGIWLLQEFLRGYYVLFFF